MKKYCITICFLLLGIMFITGCKSDDNNITGCKSDDNNITGCKSDDNNDDENKISHIHSYTSEIIAATCTQEGYTYYKCSCGDSYTDLINPVLGHDWVEGEKNYYCKRCNQSEAEGFKFKLATMDEESCYIVTSANSKAVVNGVLEIPRMYESLPVRAIGSYAFSSITKQVKKIIIHDNIKNIYSELWHGTSIWDPDWDTMSTLEEIVFDSTCSGMRIEGGAFHNCPNLSKANITKGMIRSVPVDVVAGQNGGTAEYIFKGTPYFNSNATNKNGLYYIADLLVYADLNEINSNIIIDSDTVWINPCIFKKCAFLKSVTIPNTVKVIGQSAFSECTHLETITFNGTIAEFKKITIAPSAFSGVKATSVICSDGIVESYTYNGWTYHIGK